MKRFLLVAPLALIALSACGAGEPLSSTPNPTTTPTAQAVLSAGDQVAAARQLWAENGSNSYRYQFRDLCGECDPEMKTPFGVAVYEGEMLVGDRRGYLIPTLFDLIELRTQTGERVVVEYDDMTGVPLDVKFSPELFEVDGGTHYVIEDFVLGPPGDPITTEAIDSAIGLWTEHGLDSYEYTVELICDCEDGGKHRIWITPEDSGYETISGADDVLAISFDELLSELYDIEDFDMPNSEFLFRTDPDLGYLAWLWFRVGEGDDGDGFELGEFLAVVTDFKEFEGGPVPTSFLALKDLFNAQDLWITAGYDDYSFQLTVNCLCPEEYRGPFRVQVEDGLITSATWLGKPVTDGIQLWTIEEVFDEIATAIDDAARINVQYDPTTGHPTRVDLDLDAIAVDGGLSLTIENLLPSADRGD